ncbi:hypothetical protein PoB_000998900 [Plakobranchus ocellatus]|uniref:Uncharacterized protein n=1 Tax=Plakobranchus ocellatus TaxID=259542 RepID=A0AAV3YN52_9GAST|nr:hypothetical protein PoB_000998900 [Plakobranchus ocellatus]
MGRSLRSSQAGSAGERMGRSLRSSIRPGQWASGWVALFAPPSGRVSGRADGSLSSLLHQAGSAVERMGRSLRSSQAGSAGELINLSLRSLIRLGQRAGQRAS